MKRDGVTLNERGLRMLMRPQIAARDFRGCLNRYYQLRRDGLVHGDTGGNVLFRHFAQANFSGCVELFHHLYDDARAVPSRAAYDALIQFYHHRKDNPAVLRIFIDARSRGVEVSSDSFLHAFRAAAQSAPQLIDELRTYIDQRKWLLDTYVYNGLLETYSVLKKFDACMGLFNEMQASPHGPNATTYNVLINYFGKARELAAARIKALACTSGVVDDPHGRARGREGEAHLHFGSRNGKSLNETLLFSTFGGQLLRRAFRNHWENQMSTVIDIGHHRTIGRVV